MQSMGAVDFMSKIVSLIVGAALILIIIYINVLHRKKEIGILKAVGITPRSIVFSYGFLSVFYVSLGIFVGLILYFALMFYFQANPFTMYETIQVIPEIDYLLIIKNIFTMLTMSVIAGLFLLSIPLQVHTKLKYTMICMKYLTIVMISLHYQLHLTLQ